MNSRGAWRAPYALVLCLVCVSSGCSKGDKTASDESEARSTSAVPEAGVQTGDSATATEITELFDYPPAGPGPHEGFDLAALRDRLQGTWMVGGSAFGSIPQIWHVTGDLLTKYDTEGEEHEYALELLAPCYVRVGPPGGGSATYEHFVFDGDTLYQGLGNAGLVQGSKTIGCMSAAMYVLEGDACTRWTRKAFARAGQLSWEQEAGECGFEDTGDGNVFWADDTNSSRKIYGKQTLPVRVGDALMTKQMQGNKAEKMSSLDAAVARQKQMLDAQAALQKPPEQLEWSSWQLPTSDASFEPGQRVFGAGVNRDGEWRQGSYRVKEVTGGIVWLSGTENVFAPPAFVVPRNAEPPKRGEAVVYYTGRATYGRVSRVAGDELIVSYLSGSRPSQKTDDAQRFVHLPGGFTFAAPALVKEGDSYAEASVVFDAGDKVYVHMFGKPVAAVDKASLTLIDPRLVHKRGARVLVKQSSGLSPLKWLPGKVSKVFAGGAAYEVETDDGKIYTQSWALVSKRP